jgi:hypothetical protein
VRFWLHHQVERAFADGALGDLGVSKPQEDLIGICRALRNCLAILGRVVAFAIATASRSAASRSRV